MPLTIGQTLQGRYRIVDLLGQGGMGAVYLADDMRLTGRRCAIKENIPDPNAGPQVLAQIRQQFHVEASTLATLDHPNLPKVSDYFSHAGNEYIVMDYVEGEDLESALKRHGAPLPEKPVLIWADQVLDALEYLHNHRPNPIIHRDIKPANIVLTSQGKVKLVDFGLVKLLDPNDPRTATVMKGPGTPEYAPLEQYAGGAGHTDARSDIYSLVLQRDFVILRRLRRRISDSIAARDASADLSMTVVGPKSRCSTRCHPVSPVDGHGPAGRAPAALRLHAAVPTSPAQSRPLGRDRGGDPEGHRDLSQPAPPDSAGDAGGSGPATPTCCSAAPTAGAFCTVETDCWQDPDSAVAVGCLGRGTVAPRRLHGLLAEGTCTQASGDSHHCCGGFGDIHRHTHQHTCVATSDVGQYIHADHRSNASYYGAQDVRFPAGVGH